MPQPSLRANYTYKVALVPQQLPAAEDFLNQLAVDGWRLVQYVQHSGYGIFERQGPAEATAKPGSPEQRSH